MGFKCKLFVQATWETSKSFDFDPFDRFNYIRKCNTRSNLPSTLVRTFFQFLEKMLIAMGCESQSYSII